MVKNVDKMNTKGIILSALAIMLSSSAFASDRYFSSPDLGLPGGETVGVGAAIGAVALVIGLIIVKATDKNDNSVSGCIVMLCFGVAFVCFIPLLFWLCTILSSLFSIGMVIIAIIIVVVVVISLFKK